MSITNSGKFQLLLIEDNQADFELLRVLLAQAAADIDLHWVKNGNEACEFLFKTGKYEKEMTIPDLMFMDLNVPLKDGRSLLKEIKAHPELCKIPVIMLSTSSSDREVADCYCLGASAFISKPLDIDDYQDILGVVIKFYFKCARLATRPGKT